MLVIFDLSILFNSSPDMKSVSSHGHFSLVICKSHRELNLEILNKKTTLALPSIKLVQSSVARYYFDPTM